MKRSHIATQTKQEQARPTRLKKARRPLGLLIKRGKVIGKLRRRDIYSDV